MRSREWRLFWGIVFIAVGVVWLWNISGLGPHISLWSFWPLGLIFIGIYILLRQTGHLAPLHVLFLESSPGSMNRILGSVRLGGPGVTVENQDVLTVISDVKVDLRQSILPEGESVMGIRALLGNVTVIVPASMAVFAGANVVAGDVRILGQQRDGVFVDYATSTPAYATAQRKLRVDIEMVVGEAAVVTA